jgi:hypothetical protein
MNQGGRPPGATAAKLKRERANLLANETEDERILRERVEHAGSIQACFARSAGPPATASVQQSVGQGRSASPEPSFLPDPESKKDRIDGQVYDTKDGPGRWRESDRTFTCLCNGEGDCSGVRLQRCKKKKRCHNVALIKTGPSTRSAETAVVQGAIAHNQVVLGLAQLQNLHKVLLKISVSKHEGEIEVLSQGAWEKDMASRPEWCNGGSIHGINMPFPLRIGAIWTVRCKGVHAQACVPAGGQSRDSVRIKVEIGIKESSPVFCVSNFDNGVFSKVFRGETPGVVERKWMTQHEHFQQGYTSNGRRFLGLSSNTLAEYFCSITPGFLEENSTIRGGRAEEVGERQGRRRTALIFDEFQKAMEAGAKMIGQNATALDAFKCLVEASRFAPFQSIADLHSQVKNPAFQSILDRYKASTDKKEKMELLSLVSPHQHREKTMLEFGCSARQCKQANLHHKIRALPKNYKSATTRCRILKATAAHAEIFLLRDDNVLRAAHGNGTYFMLQRLMNRHRLWLK